ncbi:MAG: DUF1993 domain-containing protein [Nitratireductor sp.]|nr:DUF1993 domain-containing protein [Nitratireductor sp.]
MATHAPLYDASIPALSAMLANLASCLKIAEANAKERNIDPQVFLNARLAPDMFALTRQVQIATDQAKGMAHRLAGREVPAMADTESSFDELQERIAKVRAMLGEARQEEFAGAEDRTVTVRTRAGEISFNGRDYLFRYGLPNFYFHLTTAYAILRHNGVPLGKPDFLGTR